MRAMKDSGVKWLGELPEDWSVKPLYAVGRETKSRNLGLIENNLLSLSYGQIVTKDINSEGGLLPESFEQYQIVNPGDLVFRFTDLQNDQRSLRTGLVTERGIITNAYLGFSPKFISPYFLSYLVHAYDLQKIFYRMGAGLRQSLNYNEVRKLPVVVPPPKVQNQIVEYLDLETSQINILISKKEQLIEKLLERRQALITHVVTKGLDPNAPMKDSGVEWLGEIPKSWDLVRLDTVFSNVNKRNTLGLGLEAYLSLMANVGIIPYAEKGNVGNKAPVEFDNCKVVEKGDFVLNSMNFRIGSFGVSAYTGILSPVYLVLRPKSRNMNYSYFSTLFMTSRFREYAQMFGSGILEHRAAIPWEKLKCVMMPVPSPEEQNEIAKLTQREFGQIDTLVAKTKKAIELLKERRQALITQVVTGKIDVRGFAGGDS